MNEAIEATKEKDRVHHRYSPSTLQNRETCPCYESRDTAHIRAIAGTLAHSVAESGKDNEKLSDEDATAAAECIDFVERRKQEMEKTRFQVIAKAAATMHEIDCDAEFYNSFPPVQELKEIYLPIDDCAFDDGSTSTTAGYVDHALIDHTGIYAELFDWKFGAWPVESAENNVQGIAYVLGLFRAFPKLITIRFFFKQPRLDSVSEAEFHRESIPALYLRIQTIVARARAATKTGDFTSANPTVPGCNFCARLGECPKVLSIACKVGSKFYPLEIPESITPSEVLAPHNTSLALRLAAVVKIWAESFRTQVSDRIIRGDAELPLGFKIQTMSKRSLLDAKKFRAVALEYLTEAEYSETLEPTFGAIETLVQDKAPRGHKKATVEEFQRRLADAGATKKGEPFSFLKSIPMQTTKTTKES